MPWFGRRGGKAWRHLAVGIAAIALLAAGCSDDDRDATAPGPAEEVEDLSDPCDLVDDDDVEAVVGPGVSPELLEGVSDEAGFPWRLCRWVAEDESVLSVATMGGTFRHDARLEFAEGVEEDEDIDLRSVDGLGEDAFLVRRSGEFSMPSAAVNVLVDGQTLEVIVQSEDETILGEVEALTRAVVERL